MIDQATKDNFIKTGRTFMRGYGEHSFPEDEFQSDQELKLPISQTLV